MNEKGEVIFIIVACIIVFVVGWAIGSDTGYKQGQLDYQRGEIEYILQENGTYYEVHKEQSDG